MFEKSVRMGALLLHCLFIHQYSGIPAECKTCPAPCSQIGEKGSCPAHPLHSKSSLCQASFMQIRPGPALRRWVIGRVACGESCPVRCLDSNLSVECLSQQQCHHGHCPLAISPHVTSSLVRRTRLRQYSVGLLPCPGRGDGGRLARERLGLH